MSAFDLEERDLAIAIDALCEYAAARAYSDKDRERQICKGAEALIEKLADRLRLMRMWRAE